MIKPCTAENMIADQRGLRMSKSWYPRLVSEAFLGSTKDGEIQRAPDPVPMIEGDVPWFNNTGAPQQVFVQVNRAARRIVAMDPVTVVMHDTWSWQVGKAPSAPRPTIAQDSFGGRLQLNKSSTEPKALKYGMLFLDTDTSHAWVPVGVVEHREALHFRFMTSVQTPGTFIAPTEREPRYEAYARWARLRVFAAPVGS